MEVENSFRKNRVNGWTREVIYTLIAVTSNVLVGAGRSYLTFLFYQLDFPDSIIKVNDEQKTWMATSIGILGPIGCIISGVIMDFFGRKIYLYFIFAPFLISWSIISLSTSFTSLVVGIMIQGLGGGMTLCVSTYIAEITTPNHRGSLLGFIMVAYNVGLLLGIVLMYYYSWNSLALSFLVFSVICLLLTYFLPESPVWLYSKGQQKKSMNILVSLRVADQKSIEFEMEEMQKFCETQKVKPSLYITIRDCLKAWRSFSVIVVLFILIQNTGYSVITAYTTMFLYRLEIPFDTARITVVCSAVGFVGSILIPVNMRRLNKKTSLSISSFIMGICLLIMVTYEEIFYLDNEKPYSWVVPVTLYTYVLICNVGTLPICSVMPGEVFPQKVSGMLNGFFGVFGFIYWVIILNVYPAIMFRFGVKTMMWISCTFCFILCLFGVFILPETRGKSLNEIQEQYFRKSKKVACQTV